MVIILNLGSNQGDRKALLEQAIALIAIKYPQARIYQSDFIETQAWGYESAYPFLNVGVALVLEEDAEPLDVLHAMQSIEKEISAMPHRNADGTYRDREIDIDIIEIDDLRINTPELTLPHPRAHLREFVAAPTAQLKQIIAQSPCERKNPQ